MHSWGEFWTQTIQRDQKTQVPLLKTGWLTLTLHTPPPKGWANHPSHHPSSPPPGHTPILTPYKEQACPSPGIKKARVPSGPQ